MRTLRPRRAARTRKPKAPPAPFRTIEPSAIWTDDTLTLRLPIRTYSETNRREFWAKKTERVGKQRTVTAQTCLLAERKPTLPVTVTFTRIAPRSLDDDAPGPAMKAVRDELAVWLGLPIRKRASPRQKFDVANDRDPRVKWKYAETERKEGVRLYGVEVVIAPMNVGVKS